MNNWETKLLGEVVKYCSGGSFPNKFQGKKGNPFDFYKISDMNKPTNKIYMINAENTVDNKDISNLKGKIHDKDTIIFPKVGAALLTNKRRILSKPALFDNNIMGLQVKGNMTPKYLYYFLNTIDFGKHVQSGAVPSINQSIVSSLEISLPPLVEQRKITAILSSVDDAIQKTEAIIEQTEKVKKGLMQQLLTKGIGHTKFKRTEIGEIPEGWEVKKLEDIAEKIFVGIATSTTNSYTSDGVPIIRNQNIKEDYLDKDDLLQITNEFSEKNKNKKLVEGDVLTVRTGYPGISCVVPKELEGSHTFTTLVSRPNFKVLNSHFLSRYINSEAGKKFVTGGKAGGAQQNLNVAIMKKLPVPIPSLQEQLKIVNIIKTIDKKIMNEKEKLYSMLEVKKGLMQDLLTGKVRVKVDETEVVTK